MDFMRHKLLFLPFLVAIVGLSIVGQRGPVDAAPLTKPAPQGPLVVELFTSQSCSSCPPADALLSELQAQNEDIIALSCHVTYWDHLNWRDTLSHKFCSDRQRAYARQMEKRQVYTPQMVVNGRHEFVGSNRTEALRSLQSGTVQEIILQHSDGQTLTATLPALTQGPNLQTLWLISYRTSTTQAITSGENGGRTVTYTNSVDTLDQVGTWNGQAQTLSFPRPKAALDAPPVAPTATRGYALIAQPYGFGPITAAGKL